LGIGEIWNLIAMQPMINILIVLSHYLYNSFGLAIIALTIAVRFGMYPLTLKQLRASKAMQELQPKLAELQKKYAKDKQALAREQMRMYKESGVSPMGCLVPMLVQMPIWIALFWSVIKVLAVTPEDFLGLSQYLYSWPIVHSMLPLANQFLWLNLAEPNTLLAILVGGTMWLQQKMMMSPTADPKQQAQSRMMLWMMPLMFGFFCLSFPSGLALYWVTSNVISIVLQYFVTGWGGLVKTAAPRSIGRDLKYKRRIAQIEQATSARASIDADIVEPSSPQEEGLDEEGLDDETSGDKLQDREQGYPDRFSPIRRQPRRGRSHRRKRR